MLQRRVIAIFTLLLVISLSMLEPTSAISWLESRRLTTYREFDGIPSITETTDGKIHAVWVRRVKQNYDLFYRTSSNSGTSWSEETMLTTDPMVDTSPAIFQDVNGTIWLVWASDRTGDYDLYCKTSADAGLSWSNETRLTTDPNLDKLPSITQTNDEKIWLVWSSDRTGDSEIFFKTYNGSAWSNETRLTNDGNVDTDPSILQTSDHRLWVFWSSCAPTQTATNDVYYKYSLDAGVSWSQSVQFTTDSEEDMWPAITQANDYTMWVIWTSNRASQPEGNWDIYYRKSLVGDVNEDGVVSIMDLAMVSQAFGAMEGDPKYDMDLDLNGDGIIDICDLSIIGRKYGAH